MQWSHPWSSRCRRRVHWSSRSSVTRACVASSLVHRFPRTKRAVEANRLDSEANQSLAKPVSKSFPLVWLSRITSSSEFSSRADFSSTSTYNIGYIYIIIVLSPFLWYFLLNRARRHWQPNPAWYWGMNPFSILIFFPTGNVKNIYPCLEDNFCGWLASGGKICRNLSMKVDEVWGQFFILCYSDQ